MSYRSLLKRMVVIYLAGVIISFLLLVTMIFYVNGSQDRHLTGCVGQFCFKCERSIDLFHIGRLHVYSNSEEGPYRGGIITVDPQEAAMSHVEGWSFPGIYYRRITLSGSTNFTFSISMWYPVILTLLPIILYCFFRWRWGSLRMR